MRRCWLAVCIWVLALFALPAPIPAVEPAEEKPRPIGGLSFAEEVEVTLVNIVAYVTDKSGSPVTDLKPEDFRVVQDGETKQVTNFQLYSGDVTRHTLEAPTSVPTATPVPEAADVPPPLPVQMAVYVDNENLNPLDRNRLLKAVREFVRNNLRPPARMMVASFDKRLKVVQPFTSDPLEVIEALNDLSRVTGGRSEREGARRDIIDEMQRLAQEEGTVIGGGKTRNREYLNLRHQILAYADEEANSLSFALDGLREVVSFMSGLPGRKSILYLSNGLPMVPGVELITALANQYQDHSLLTELTRYDRTRWFTSLASSANAQEVSFYTIDASGMDVTGIATAEQESVGDTLAAGAGASSYVDSLRYLADATGGLAVVKTNNFRGGLERIERDVTTYYSLGYPLNQSGGDKVHHIEVTLPNRPDCTLRFRRQFVEKSLETRVQDKVLTGLLFDLEENPMQLEVASGAAAPATGGTSTVPLHLSFPLESIALLPEGEDYVGRVVLFIAARDKEGRRSDLVRQEHEVRVKAADYPKVQSQRFGIDTSLLMQPGVYRVAVGLMDQVTRQAAYHTLKTTVEAG